MGVTERGKWHGVANIVWFNWHWFVIGSVVIVGLFAGSFFIEGPFKLILLLLGIGAFSTTLFTLFVSHLIYDRSGIYDLDWLSEIGVCEAKDVVILTAGFDEVSGEVRNQMRGSEVQVFDFFDREKHTEISIERARKKYPAVASTLNITTSEIPKGSNSTDLVILFFAAHEIRDDKERVQFFKEIERVAKTDAKIVVVEHLRDFRNLMVYNLGAFHFFPRKTWRQTFESSQLKIENEFSPAPLVTGFILSRM